MLWLVVAAGCGSGEEARTSASLRADPRPNLVLISIDTLRADHLGSHGYARATDPHLAQLASDGIVFEAARAQSSWTLPSLASLHTSLYPNQHGAVRKGSRVSDDLTTVAEALRAAGYRTRGITSHIFANAEHGFAQGFDAFDESQVRGHAAVTSRDLTDLGAAAVEELAKRGPDAPFFLWIHYFDSHFTYVRHVSHDFTSGDYAGPLGDRVSAKLLKSMRHQDRLSDADLAHAIALYDGEIAFQDAEIGRLLAALETNGLAERTLVLVAADHGEAFLEHGRLFHGRDAYDELLRVPLVIGGALDEGLRGARVAAAVEVASVPATLMEAAGIGKHPFRGPSLLEVARTRKGPDFTASVVTPARTEGEGVIAVMDARWKLVHRQDEGRSELFDLETDPRERNDRSADDDAGVTAARERLQAELQRIRGLGRGGGATLELSEEQLRHLEELGYVE